MIYRLIQKRRKLECSFVDHCYKRGFTLIELAVVFALLVLFLSLVFPRIPYIREERVKSEARKLAGVISSVLDATLRERKNLKFVIQREENGGKIKIMECLPADIENGEEQEELEMERRRKIEELMGNFGDIAPFLFSGLGQGRTSFAFSLPRVCEWKERKEIDIRAQVSSVFVEAEETFGSEVEVMFQPTKIPFIEVQLEDKFWVILNPYNFKVFVDEKPAHLGD